MQKMYRAYVNYTYTKKRLLRSAITDTERYPLGYFYGELEKCFEKAKHSTYLDVGDTLHNLDFYPAVITHKVVSLEEITADDYVSFKTLQDQLPHEDFVQYCRDNFNSLNIPSFS